MNSPIIKWGLTFAGVYLLGWVTVVPRIDQWWSARERLRQLQEEMSALNVTGAPAKQPVAESSGVVEAALRESGLTYERMDPRRRSSERDALSYAVSFSGDLGRLVRFLERTRRGSPRVVVRALTVRSKESGVAGEMQVVLKWSSQVASSRGVTVAGRDPFHAPPPPPVPAAPAWTPPPMPEPTILLKLIGLRQVRDPKRLDQVRSEGMVFNETTRSMDLIVPDSFRQAGFTLEFDVPQGLVRILREGQLVREWRKGESVNQKMLTQAPGDTGLPRP